MQKHTQDDIEMTYGIHEQDEEKGLVTAGRERAPEVTVDAVVELIGRSLSEQYNVNLSKFDVETHIKYKRRVRADLI